MLSLLCVSFRDAKRCNGLRRTLGLGGVERRTITKGSHKYGDEDVSQVVRVSFLTKGEGAVVVDDVGKVNTERGNKVRATGRQLYHVIASPVI
jgi:hypothetical protein